MDKPVRWVSEESLAKLECDLARGYMELGTTLPACLVSEIRLLQTELTVVRALLGAAVAELRRLEWVDDEIPVGWCPSCRGPEETGHTPDCTLAAILDRVGGERGGEEAVRPMPATDWKATAQLMGRKMRRAERALRMAYRKHHLGDETIGWNELSDELAAVLCEFMGDREFQQWSKDPATWDYPENKGSG